MVEANHIHSDEVLLRRYPDFATCAMVRHTTVFSIQETTAGKERDELIERIDAVFHAHFLRLKNLWPSRQFSLKNLALRVAYP